MQSPQQFRYPWSWNTGRKVIASAPIGIMIPDFISEGKVLLLAADNCGNGMNDDGAVQVRSRCLLHRPAKSPAMQL